MEAGLLSTLYGLLVTYGYYLIFLILLLENTTFIGLIVPGETVLLLASFLASQGEFEILTVILVAMLASFLGNNIGYFLGRKGGRPLVERLGEKFFISRERIKAAENYFDIHGGKTVFIGRFATGIRVFIPALAGAAHMNYPKFFFYTFFAVVTWTLMIGALGYLFGEYWSQIIKFIKGMGWGALILLILFVVIVLFSRRKSDVH